MIIFEDGSRVGSSVDRINEFDADIIIKGAMRGKHSISLPDWKDVHFEQSLPKNKPRVMRNVINHWKQPTTLPETKNPIKGWMPIIASAVALALIKCKN